MTTASDEHDIEIVPDSERGGFAWSCDTCAWAGLGCPSEDFARREHEGVVADIRDGILAAGGTMFTVPS